MKKVILDSNVIISAFVFGGNPLKVLMLAIDGQFEVYVSKEIKVEVLDKLLNKFKFGMDFVVEVLGHLLNFEEIELRSRPKVSRDTKDDFLFAIASEVNADCIVTGDKDLLELKAYQKTRIMKPRDFLLEISK